MLSTPPPPSGTEHVIIPAWVWNDERIATSEDLLIVIHLLACAQTGEPPMARLAQRMGWPEQHIEPMIAALREAGVIHPTELTVQS